MTNRLGRPRNAGLPATAWLSVASAALLLAVHALMTFLHITPVNPVKVEYEGAVARWTEPLFTQNWKLFAPDPISVDQGVLVRVRLADGSVTEFRDVTTPFLEAKHHNLVPSRAGYQVSGVVTRLLETRQDVEAAAKEGLPVFVTDTDLARANANSRVAYRQALADLRDAAVGQLHINLEGVRGVQLRIVQHEFPRFSKRADQGLGKVAFGTSGWLGMGELA